jgi:putative oxidoreductase
MIAILNKLQDLLERSFKLDFLAPLLLRFYLAPVFYMAGLNKFNSFESTVAWFGNPDWGLGLPMPWLMAALATATELGGAFLLAFGFATRWISIPLIFTMFVAIVTVHWQNGWLAIAGGGLFGTERTAGALDRLDRAKSILTEHGNYEWLTEQGSYVVLNNGIEFAATYLVMLLALLFLGGGRYVSVDYWIKRSFRTTG